MVPLPFFKRLQHMSTYLVTEYWSQQHMTLYMVHLHSVVRFRPLTAPAPQILCVIIYENLHLDLFCHFFFSYFMSYLFLQVKDSIYALTNHIFDMGRKSVFF